MVYRVSTTLRLIRGLLCVVSSRQQWYFSSGAAVVELVDQAVGKLMATF